MTAELLQYGYLGHFDCNHNCMICEINCGLFRVGIQSKRDVVDFSSVFIRVSLTVPCATLEHLLKVCGCKSQKHVYLGMGTLSLT
jgi:hypothetical protein